MRCAQCNKGFEAFRENQKFCDWKCRVAANRERVAARPKPAEPAPKPPRKPRPPRTRICCRSECKQARAELKAALKALELVAFQLQRMAEVGD